MTEPTPYQDFLDALTHSVDDSGFIKVSLVHYTGSEPLLKTIIIKKTIIKRQEKLSFTYRYKNRDIVKNYEIADGIGIIAEALDSDFHAATLYTTDMDLVFETDRNQKQRVRKSAPTQTAPASLSHDRQKNRLIGSAAAYLHDLGITNAEGAVVKASQDKYRQINKFVEIISGLIKESSPDKIKNIIDMGAGKGYLTFALYDYMTTTLGLAPHFCGIEAREDMVHLCNKIARKNELSGLEFRRGTIEECDASGVDLLIALHACDTATDDAIAKGIKADAELIVVAPCCHKQIRREIDGRKKENDLKFLLEHGIFMERQAEMVTDGMRSLILNYFGYTTKVFEFISDAHTPKNVMIVGRRTGRGQDHAALEKLKAAKAYFGIESHHLERAMGLVNLPV